MGPEMIYGMIKYSIPQYYGNAVRLGRTSFYVQNNEKEFINFSFWFQVFCFAQVIVKNILNRKQTCLQHPIILFIQYSMI